MNILFLNSIEKETYGGMEEWIRLTASGLVDRGHSVAVAGRPESEFLNRISKDSSEISVLPLKIRGDFSPATISKLIKYLTAQRVDVIVVNFNKDVRLGGLAARLKQRPKVIWSVGLDITKDSLVHHFLTPKLVDGVIVPSHSLKKQITRLGYIKEDIVHVIPIGIADNNIQRSDKEASEQLRIKYGWPDESLIAVTVGRFVNQKGHRYLIEAAQQIVRHNHLARFIFVGDGPLRGDLEELIDRKKLTDSIALTGMMKEIDLELAGADMMIHPSVEEPFGIAILEGMRAGLPIVASRVGGIPEVVAENESAILVPPRDSVTLAASVIDMFDNEEYRTSMANAGRERWQHNFRVETMINRVEDCLYSHCDSGEFSRG
ncbi:MAG: glycosyltransferase family 4 protein [candidate division Zixibacteria bacterium]|nr:glycosyltransferase family 4 protein [candidate division Zixibacteria bacterium]